MVPQYPTVTKAQGGLSPADGKAISLELNRRAGENPLYRETKVELPAGRNASWRISPEPYAVPLNVFHQIQQLGNHLLAFYKAVNRLYQESVKGRQPAWVHQILDQGKPEALIDYQRMNRFKQLTPMVIRPDLIINEEGKLVACELDSVPGGIGFTGSMATDYADFGYSLIGGADGLVEGFARMIRDVAGKESPVLAIVVSEESNDYWFEQQWIAERLNGMNLRTVVLRPGDLIYTEEGMLLPAEHGRTRVDVVYRFFELFDLKNLPKAELLQYANKKQQVIVTPPYKAFLEEKMTFALFHHPVLRPFWQQELGKEAFAVLEGLIPKTWILDPTPLPPQAVIPGITVNGAPVTDWLQLANTTKKERAYVVKPSGFSNLAWGSHGISFGTDLSNEDWAAALKNALGSFETTPYLLQEFHKPAKTTTSYYNFRKEEVVSMDARARICPYYYVVGGEAQLSGVLTTLVPLDKLAIHGMTDAVMVPTMVAEK
ncbi:MAG: hypothetical protein ACK46X_14090 [Candidatus Sericytochromatia bacterium]